MVQPNQLKNQINNSQKPITAGQTLKLSLYIIHNPKKEYSAYGETPGS
jgi:hypothetical protein